MKPTIRTASNFLAALGDQHTFQTFGDADKRPELVRTFHGTIDQHQQALMDLNQQGAGVFFTVSETDGQGRKAGNVTRVRALFVDHDIEDHDRDLTQYGLDPSLIVESSPGKHHIYWLLRDFPLERFEEAQRLLATAYGGDGKVHDLPRVMRVPGFIHRKGEPFQTRILHHGGEVYDRDTVATWLNHLKATHKPPERRSAPAPAHHADQGDRYARATLESALGAVMAAGEGSRNDTLNVQALGLFRLVKAGRLDAVMVEERLTAAALAIGLKEGETRATLASARTAAQPSYEGLDRSRPSRQIQPDAPSPDSAQGEPEGDKEKESQATALVRFVCERAELFHDESRDSFATLHATGETLRLDTRAFKDWLQSQFYEREQKAARDQSTREALTTLTGLARHRGEQKPVYLRAAEHDGVYYLDLCKSGSSAAVKLEPGKWSVVDKPPVRFVRTEAMQALPTPIPGGTLDGLWATANIPPDDHVLFVAWLVDCLRPETPFPIIELIGEAGTAKSTTQRALRRVIDPNACDLRQPPRTAEDLFVGAGVSWLVSLENVSHLPAPMQDALCVLATGGGFAKRKLYSDGDEAVINAKRPIIINGISANVTAQDLADRAISVELPVIRTRHEDTALMRDFERSRASILGGLLDIAAQALKELDAVEVPADERPRMLSFYRLGLAVGRVMGQDFASRFKATKADALARTLDANPVAAALMNWFESCGRRERTLSAKDLMSEVAEHRYEGTEAWPRSPKGFGDALRRAAPALRQLDVSARSTGRKSGGSILWEVKCLRENFSNQVPKVPEVPGHESSPFENNNLPRDFEGLGKTQTGNRRQNGQPSAAAGRDFEGLRGTLGTLGTSFEKFPRAPAQDDPDVEVF